jgi:undecaprenyl phosphate-alpha-L-ara4FN deformylase
MQLLALKIDADTLRGTREGVPRLVEILQQYGVGATFLFSLGPDHTGRALKRVLRPGFLKKVSRTSVLEHYGLQTLLYGTLLPGPDIGKKAAHVMQATAEAGFEVGIHCWDHIRWQDGVGKADQSWTMAEIDHAYKRFREVFGIKAHTHGAAGWQMNIHGLRYLDDLKMNYASDCRGTHPFLPVVNGELFSCPQFPTTLPTLDELIGLNDITPKNVSDHLLSLTSKKQTQNQVFTLHAELEGMKFLPQFETLIKGWLSQGWKLVSLSELAESYRDATLPRHQFLQGSIQGRSGTMSLQGPAFPPSPLSQFTQ